MITVLLADDYAIIRDGLRAILEAAQDIRVIADAADGREAVRLAQQQCPDVVVMDIAMPELNGIEATRQIAELCPNARVIVLSIHASNEYVYRALKAGAQGYLLKESAGNEVIEAVRAVQAGHRYLNHKITDIVIDGYLGQSEAVRSGSPLDVLSPREQEVLQLVVEGKTSAEIADVLSLSQSTVETYRSRIMNKLGIRDLPSLVKFAIQHGVTPLE